MQVEMKVKGLMVDPVTNMPIVILKDESENHVLPIWVGIFEANAIALKAEAIDTPRPMTHDLLHSMVGAFGARVDKIVVTDLRENTYFAMIHMDVGGSQVTVDSRPSDALALALRTEAPIFVEEAVLDQARSVDDDRDLSNSERLRRWFENLDPDEFSKYEM
ncbi:MAG TPA: bifunctional nuclease family protein [Acidobacteriota bacterium]|nr:bifunctional nuclease family protein [Acidobacteriota bacterium]